LTLIAFVVFGLFVVEHAFAQGAIKGQVLGGGAPIAQSSVTLWEASAAAPKQLAQAQDRQRRAFSNKRPQGTNQTPAFICWR
jgi:hypothetical protein